MSVLKVRSNDMEVNAGKVKSTGHFHELKNPNYQQRIIYLIMKTPQAKLSLKSYLIIFFIVMAANIITHVFIEFYNNPDDHLEALEEGVEMGE